MWMSTLMRVQTSYSLQLPETTVSVMNTHINIYIYIYNTHDWRGEGREEESSMERKEGVWEEKCGREQGK